jgi:hypothetical protein
MKTLSYTITLPAGTYRAAGISDRAAAAVATRRDAGAGRIGSGCSVVGGVPGGA